MAEQVTETSVEHLKQALAEAVSLLAKHYEDCVDTELSDEALKDLVKKYPNGAEELSLKTRIFLRRYAKKENKDD